MKFTVALVGLLSISSTWAAMDKKVEEQKDKREAPVGYPSSGHATHTLQIQPSHSDGNAVSIGAGYSIGGAKPSFSYGAPESSPSYQLASHSLSGGHGQPSYQLASLGQSSGGHEQATYQLSPYGQSSGGHEQAGYQLAQHGQSSGGDGQVTYKLAPITLDASHGSFASADLNQLMSQLSHGLSTGAISLQPAPEAASYHGGQAQELSLPQFSYGAPKLQQQYSFAEQGHSSQPSYSAGSKGLGSYSTGPVLFSPSTESHSSSQATSYAPSSGYSFGDSSSLASHSLGNSGYSLGGLSLGGGAHSFAAPSKSYGHPGKNAFKPSAFLGATVSDSSHGLSSLSGSYGAPSFGGHGAYLSGSQLSGGHLSGGQLSGVHGHGYSHGSSSHSPSFGSSFGGFGGGSTKYVSAAPSYLSPKSEGYGSSQESVSSLSGHSASPPSTTYGVPSGSYLPASSAHSASSSPHQYYVSSSKYPSSASSFGSGHSSYRAPSSSHSSFSSSPKYSFGGHSHSSPSSRFGLTKDIDGAYSESSYNTIKYSEELKPHPQ